MIKRCVNGENARRKGIIREATNLMRDGWLVMAKNIPGFHNPPELEGYIPDIYAVRKDKTIIIDLLVSESEEGEVYRAHYHYSRQDRGTDYYCWDIDPAGSRRE